MKTRFAVAVGTALAVLLPGAVVAADGTPVDVASIATWFGEHDYAKGLVLALFGLVGAVFVMFTLVGGVIPGTAGKAQLDKDRELLDRLTASMEQALDKGTKNAAQLREAVNQLRDDYNRERRNQYLVAGGMYLVLGAFFAALLAHDVLQALAFGAGWTGLVGSVGLKNDFEQRKDEKDASLGDLTAALAKVANRPAPRRSRSTRQRRAADGTVTRTVETMAIRDMTGKDLDNLLAEAETARAL